MSDIDNVKVALRIRPLVQTEINRGCQEVVIKPPGVQQVIVNGNIAFTFNHVFDAKDTQEYVYNECVSNMLDKLSSGFNATILAYGQTGSGKTHTMGTAFNGEQHSDIGVIPRAIGDIFKRVEQDADKCDFIVTCSFMELYQEQLYDLLSSQPREQSIVEMREDRNGIVLTNLTEFRVRSVKETTDCLLRGSGGRAVASTAMNQQSSRSHAIFCVTIKTTHRTETQTVTTSKFHLVDLAGSERSKKTEATGDRFKEGVKINHGLLALGNVISALGSNQSSGFIGYRDSKLTRLLQDSLGGNSITLMIACVSPADYNVAETLSTLRYADRARKIKNKPIVNQDPHAAEISRLKGIIQNLRLELLDAVGSLTGEQQKSTPATVSITQSNKDLQEKYNNLQQQLQITLHDVAENEMRAHIAEAAHDQLKAKTSEIKHLFVCLKDLSTTETPLPEHINCIAKIHDLVDGIDQDLERTQSEMTGNKRRHSLSVSNIESNKDGSVEIQALMQEQTDAFTSKQMGFNEQLRRINRELSLKEELQQRVAGNLNKFCTMEDKNDDKFKECETKIQALEAEKADLLDKLRHVRQNPSVKLAEERRKRLQTLEQEISEMKRHNTQQAKLLKVREKETEKIRNLSSEIQSMKEAKVKLIRAMRQESENFRQWKLTREKELVQLKNKDRKLQNEMARKEALHTKQRNVLKRKCEEAQAINKRLKDVLERQKTAQSQRQKTNITKNGADSTTIKMEQVIASVERELDVIMSLMDAEHSLEQLMEDRCFISARIAELQHQQQQEPQFSSAADLASLQEEFEMRNAQIADLQQKVCAADLNARIRSLCETIQNLAEARVVLKHLLKSIGEMRREYDNRSSEQRAALEEQQALRISADERSVAAAKRLRQLEIEYEKIMAERENTYEEKIALLLRELANAPNPVAGATCTPEQEELRKIQDEMLNKMDKMRAELEEYRSLMTEMEGAVKKKRETRKTKYKDFSNVEDDDVDEDIEDDNISNDPDWRKTPRYSNTKRSRIVRKDGSSSVSAIGDNASNGSDVTETKSLSNNKNKKRSNKHGCGCRGHCADKRCGCHSMTKTCTALCLCTMEQCSNGKTNKIEKSYDDDDDDDDEDSNIERDSTTENESSINNVKKEDMNTDDEIAANSKVCEVNGEMLTPKITRPSNVLFTSAMKKKKFFQ